MCNPPFFETIEEAGLNPKTSCGGTVQMVCPGGESAFITRIIEDSVQLRQSFWWYTSMVGRKTNLKVLISKLWEVGATIGLQRHQSAFDVLQSVESYFCNIGASSKLDSASFKVDVSLSAEQCKSILKTQTQNGTNQDILISANCPSDQLNGMRLCVSVFQQIPGTLLV
ncbi:hypothetical protein H5410_011452 [Solanum commersonii]|uniref:Uncharacterized protein n=1 Tax=Solanum commersonii TaxID=4109 RepID=A0A9J6APY8_SOLCO|nr:hypothetical protein H5410_011452 [Solanum commersonii]